MFLLFAYGGVCFYAGLVSGMHIGLASPGAPCEEPVQKAAVSVSHEAVGKEASDSFLKADDVKTSTMDEKRFQAELDKLQQDIDKKRRWHSPHRRFGKNIEKFATGAAMTSKKDFMKVYDYGTPFENPSAGEQDVLILYNSLDALPSDKAVADAAMNDNGNGLPRVEPLDATANCDAMNVITSKAFGRMRQCVAIVSNFESYHVQRWMRVPENENEGGSTGALDRKLPLRHVSTGHAKDGFNWSEIPNAERMDRHWGMMRTFLNNLDAALAELKPIAERSAVDNTIIVMTCNKGNSPLLINFVCSMKKRNIDVKNILVFAADRETKILSEGLGLNVYWNEKIFETLPPRASYYYGDKTYEVMVYAKAVCAQMINMLGYDLLFQDADIVWYKNPLELFRDTTNSLKNFDIIFQDDGAHVARFTPYCANSGFYYVRHNRRTRSLLTSMLNSADRILGMRSHQRALISLLNEHATFFGLRVKILDRDGGLFPNGFHYNQRKDFMHDLMKGKTDSYIFHMNWTRKVPEKYSFFRQMGEWYVKEKCIADATNGVKESGEADNDADNAFLIGLCCSSEPLVSCHYRDKPSKTPCKDSPPLVKGGVSFWD